MHEERLPHENIGFILGIQKLFNSRKSVHVIHTRLPNDKTHHLTNTFRRVSVWQVLCWVTDVVSVLRDCFLSGGTDKETILTVGSEACGGKVGMAGLSTGSGP